MTQRHKLPCRSVDPETFFPVGTTGPALIQIELAKTFCSRCPITAECLDYALEHAIEFGVWGGMSEDERRMVRRRGNYERIRYREGSALARELASA